MLASIDESGNVIPDSELDDLHKAKGHWDELMRSIRGVRTELGGFIAESVTSVRGLEPLLAETVGALTPFSGKKVQGVVDRLLPEKPASGADDSNAAGAADALAAGKATEENLKLKEQLDILRAGGELQLQLKKAEEDHAAAEKAAEKAGHTAAEKAGHTALAKQYADEISQLKAIIALEAAKKSSHEKLPDSAAAKAELALSLKQQQDLLTVWKAGAAGREEVDKEEYEKGTLGLKAYFDLRRTELEEETAKEIAVLEQERDQVAAAAELAYQQAGQKKIEAAAAPTSQAKAQLDSEADRLTAEHLNQLARVDELKTQISAREIESSTKITALNAEQFKAETDAKQKILEFQKEIDELQGKESAGTREAIALKIQEMAPVREKLKDNAEALAQIDRQIAQYSQLKTAADEFPPRRNPPNRNCETSRFSAPISRSA